jgi:hypothetical protein
MRRKEINDIRGNSSNSREIFEALYLFVDESSLLVPNEVVPSMSEGLKATRQAALGALLPRLKIKQS